MNTDEDEDEDEGARARDAKEAEQHKRLLTTHCTALMEHFDAVEIMATKYNDRDGRTAIRNYGRGNWHTRYGLVSEVKAYMDKLATK